MPITSTSKQTSKSFKPSDPRGIRLEIGLVATEFPLVTPARALRSIHRLDQGEMSTGTEFSGGVQTFSSAGGGGSAPHAITNAAAPASAQPSDQSSTGQS